MVGYGPNKGLVPKLCDRLFQAMRENQDTRQCQVRSGRGCFCIVIIYQQAVSCMGVKIQNLFVLGVYTGLFQYVGNL